MNTSTNGGGAAAIDSHISKSSSTNDTTTATTTARKRKCTDNKGKTNVIEELGFGGVSGLCASLVTGVRNFVYYDIRQIYLIQISYLITPSLYIYCRRWMMIHG